MSGTIATIPLTRARWDRVRLDVRGLGVAAAFVVAYVILDRVSYVQPVLKFGISPWNPEVGLTLAFLLIRGPRWFPVTALAAYLAEVLVRDRPAAWWVLAAASLWLAMGYAILSVLLRRWGMPRPIDSPAIAARLCIASLITSIAVGIGYVLIFVGVGALPSNVALGSVARYCVGDLTGILTLTPLVLYAHQWRQDWKVVRRHVLRSRPGLPLSSSHSRWSHEHRN